MSMKVMAVGEILEFKGKPEVGSPILVEINLYEIESKIEDYATDYLDMITEDECRCDCGIDDYEIEDIISYLEYEGYYLTEESLGNNLRENIALTELYQNIEQGNIPIEEIEKLNDKNNL